MEVYILFLDRPHEEPSYCGVFSTRGKACDFITNDDYPHKEHFRIEAEQIDKAYTVIEYKPNGDRICGYKQF